jgi:hypothetical protein
VISIPFSFIEKYRIFTIKCYIESDLNKYCGENSMQINFDNEFIPE